MSLVSRFQEQSTTAKVLEGVAATAAVFGMGYAFHKWSKEDEYVARGVKLGKEAEKKRLAEQGANALRVAQALN